MFGAAAGSLSLCLSLRRYLPSVFGKITPKRMLAELLIFMNMYCLVGSIAMSNAMVIVAPLRRRLWEQGEAGYVAVVGGREELVREIAGEQGVARWRQGLRPVRIDLV
jgi:hypothetical protein